MAHRRNPRFAPEFLERRLSPSSAATSVPLVTAVHTLDDPEPLPPRGPGDPHPQPPTIPSGPDIPDRH